MRCASSRSRFLLPLLLPAWLTLGCGGTTTTENGSRDGSVEDSVQPSHDARHEGSVADAERDTSVGDAAQCDGAAPPDGSTACNGFSPGDCADTPCSTEGVMCSYPSTGLTGVCCGGFWSCIGP